MKLLWGMYRLIEKKEFFEKSCPNVWWFQKNVIPLHSLKESKGV